MIGEHSVDTSITSLTRSVGSLLWYLLGRAFIVTIFLVGTVFVGQRYPVEILLVPELPLLVVLTVTFLQICFSLLWLLFWHQRLQYFVQVQLVWDIVLSILIVYITGGITSLFPFLFIFVILSCAIIASRSDLYATVGTVVLLYTALVGLQYYDYLPLPPASALLSNTDILYRLVLNVTVFLLTGFLGAILASRFRSSEQLLQRERNDYAELELLNHTILQSIPSGLIVVDTAGGIYAFNVAAANICEIAVSQAYNVNLAQILPGLSLSDMQIPVERCEFSHISNNGEEKIIGYNATSIPAGVDNDTKILITFQDLTETKKLEHNLQLGERLAAVGKLAAGLAHEIRNPLTSLGGSIQLLAEQVAFNDSDKSLFNIVQRETQRLNSLVSDFLVFAKPQLPKVVSYDLCTIIHDVVALTKADPLFFAVDINYELGEKFMVMIDPYQIHQAIWNLLVNAAQFSQPPKKIVIGISVHDFSFWVDDNGPGIALALRSKIFEPFFTSRPNGTGLGLSIVHAIITGHGGVITCDDNAWGGARLMVNLKQSSQKVACSEN